jgi:HEAT repeat protein
MKPWRFQLKLRHMLGLVAAAAAFIAVMQYRAGVYDPALAQARRLRAFDPDARLAALTELGKLGPEARSEVPALLGALNDGDPRVRARAAQVLTSLRPDEDDDPYVGDVRSALTAALGDPDPRARHAAAVALGRFRPDPRVAVPALIEAAGDADHEVRAEAMNGLADFMEDEAARAAVLAAIGDGDTFVRLRAIGALAWRPTPARLPTIRAAVAPMLRDPDRFVRASAVEILCRNSLMSSPDAPELVAALSDPDPEVRRRAATFLPYRLGSRTVIPALVRAMTDPEPWVRLGAVRRLGSIGLPAEEALPALRRATEDPEDQIRRDAATAIRSIEAKAKDFRDEIFPRALSDLASPEADIRRNAAQTLGDFGLHSAPAVPALTRCLDDPDTRVRRAATWALAAIRGDALRP